MGTILALAKLLVTMNAETNKIAVKTLAISLTVALLCPIGFCLSFPWLYRSQVPVLVFVETHPDIVEARVSGKKVPEDKLRNFMVKSKVLSIRVDLKLKNGERREFDVLYSPDEDSNGSIYTDGKIVTRSRGINVRPKAPLVLAVRKATH